MDGLCDKLLRQETPSGALAAGGGLGEAISLAIMSSTVRGNQ